MAKINGTTSTIVNDTDTLLHTTSSTLNVNQDLPDATNKGSSGWAEHINGLRDWSIDFEGMADSTGSGLTFDEIVALIVGRTADADVDFTYDGTNGWHGNGTFQNITIDAPVEGTVTFSGTIVGNGALAAI
jgi:predicted secreted protein